MQKFIYVYHISIILDKHKLLPLVFKIVNGFILFVFAVAPSSRL